MTPAERVLSALPDAKRNGSGWIARCPAHDDRRASLSVSAGDDGRALVHCHAGCETATICRSLGIAERDLFASNNGTASPQIVATYDYRDAAGTLLYQVVRFDPKDFRQRRPDGCGGWSWSLKGVQRIPYRMRELVAARSDAPIFVTEGEKDCAAATALGFIATTSAGGANAARQTDWAILKERCVVVLPHHDKAGQKFASDVCRLARAVGAISVRVAHLSALWPTMPIHGDLHDLIHDPRSPFAGCEPAEIRAAIEKLADAAEPCAIEAESATRAIESFRPFPVEALPERMRQFVEAVAAATGTDPAFAALAALVVATGCVGNRVAALVKGGWIEPAALWGVLIGKSGATKSPVLKLATRAIVELYKDARREFSEAMIVYEREAERYKIRLDEWKREQKKGPPTDPPEAPTRPIEKRTIVSDTTIEKLGELLESNPLGLLLVRDELAAWVGSFDKYSGGKGSDQPAWLSFYDAATTIIDRKNGGSYFIERAAVSVVGSIQPGTLARVFGLAERESGLLARILVAYPPDRPGLWTDESLPDAVADDWKRLVQSLLAIPPGVDEGGELRPRFIPIGRDAKPLWIEWHDRHARELADIGDDALAAHFSKLKGACIRFALIFTCVEVASGGAAISHISADAMTRAIAVVEWFKNESRRVYLMLGESVEDRASRLLIEWIEKRGGVATVREVQTNYRPLKEPGAAEAALNRLAEAGRGVWRDLPAGASGGRPRRELVLNAASASAKPNNSPVCEGFADADSADEPKIDPPENDDDGFAEFEL